jgi:hypothetical protein
MISKLVDNKKIVTAPDQDFTRGFKILLVDFEWASITDLADAIQKLPLPVTVFLYGSNDKDTVWCINQAKNCNSVLLNMRHKGNIETLKGFLLGEPNVYTYGYHDLDKLFQRNVLDTMSWLAIQYEYWYKTNEATNGLEIKHT